MDKTSKRIFTGAFMGLVLLLGAIWLLGMTLGNNNDALYSGRPADYWQEQLNSRDSGASNAALLVVQNQVIPQLVDTLLHDTKDSRLRLVLIQTLNGLPGVQIAYLNADGRRAGAAFHLGEFGPAGQAAIPALIQTLKNEHDLKTCQAAMISLGKIRSDPEVVIPLLTLYLGNDQLDDQAALALGDFGSQASRAIPNIIPLLQARDKDSQMAAREALKNIDPDGDIVRTNLAP